MLTSWYGTMDIDVNAIQLTAISWYSRRLVLI